MTLTCGPLVALVTVLLPVACNPVTTARPTAAEVRALIGKSHLDDGFFALAERFSTQRTASYYKNGLKTFHHTWRESGFDASFDADGRCGTVFLYSQEVREGGEGERHERYGPYPGEMPFGLTFRDNRDAVLKKLGTDGLDEPTTDDPWMHRIDYRAKGVGVEFNKPRARIGDPDCRVQMIVLSKPKAADE